MDELRASVDRQSDDLTRKAHRAILITWLVVCLGLAATLSFTLYVVQTQVIGELLTVRGSIQALADGQLDQTIPYLNQTNEIGAISRALGTLQGNAREREIQHWVKAEVSGITEQLQYSENFEAVGRCLFSRLSNSIPLLYAALYVADESRTRLVRVGGFALDGPDQTQEFALGEGLVGQAAVERRVFGSPGKRGRSRLCFGRDGHSHAPYSLVHAGGQSRSRCGSAGNGTGFIAIGAPAGPARCTAARFGRELGDIVRQYQDKKASRADPSSGRKACHFRTSDHRPQGRTRGRQPGFGGLRSRIATRQRSGRRSHPDQIRLPGQYEPRDPNTDECHHRHVASGPEDRTQSSSEGLCPKDSAVRPALVGHH